MNWVDQWLPNMKENGGGRFVGTSSLQSLVSAPGGAAYGSSKTALNYSFKALDAMYYKDNIRFSLIYPGPVDTAMLKTDKPLPFTWRPDKAGRYIVKKTLKGANKIQFPIPWVLLTNIGRCLPKSLLRAK